MATQEPVKQCPKCGETKPLRTAFYKGRSGWCKKCTNSRPKKQTSARLLRTRARNRATQALAKHHPEEFRVLYEQFLENCQIEAEVLDAVADRFGGDAVRLLPGRRGPGQDPADRINEQWHSNCTLCSEYHGTGHICPHCASSPNAMRDGKWVSKHGVSQWVPGLATAAS